MLWLRKRQLQFQSETNEVRWVRIKVGESENSPDCDFHLNGESLRFPTSRGDGGDLLFLYKDTGIIVPFFVETVYNTSPNRVAVVMMRIDFTSQASVYIDCYFRSDGVFNYSNAYITYLEYLDFTDAPLGALMDTQSYTNRPGYCDYYNGIKHIAMPPGRGICTVLIPIFPRPYYYDNMVFGAMLNLGSELSIGLYGAQAEVTLKSGSTDNCKLLFGGYTYTFSHDIVYGNYYAVEISFVYPYVRVYINYEHKIEKSTSSNYPIEGIRFYVSATSGGTNYIRDVWRWINKAGSLSLSAGDISGCEFEFNYLPQSGYEAVLLAEAMTIPRPGKVSGRVFVNSAPARKRVVAIERDTMIPAGGAWSDSEGHYVIHGLDMLKKYMIVCSDETQTYNAAIADYVSPEEDS